MKKDFLWAAVFVAVVCCVGVGYNKVYAIDNEKEIVADTMVEEFVEEEEPLEEEVKLAMAFAMAESGMNANARNGNCVGVLQITPVLVAECNRILGYEAFTLRDREDMCSSVAMFCVMMDRYNPAYDMRKACKIWNPRAGEWYYERVKRAYENL